VDTRRNGAAGDVAMNVNPILITKAEAAALLHISPDTVMRMVKRGAMPKPAIRKTNLVRFHRETIEQWARENCPCVNRHGWKPSR